MSRMICSCRGDHCQGLQAVITSEQLAVPWYGVMLDRFPGSPYPIGLHTSVLFVRTEPSLPSLILSCPIFIESYSPEHQMRNHSATPPPRPQSDAPYHPASHSPHHSSQHKAAGGGFLSSLKGGAGSLMKNIKDASSKVAHSVSQTVS